MDRAAQFQIKHYLFRNVGPFQIRLGQRAEETRTIVAGHLARFTPGLSEFND